MIAVCPNPFRDIELENTRKVIDILKSAGYETAVCPVFCDDQSDIIPEDILCSELMSVVPECNLIIVIGGDGTMLSVARTIHDYEVPMLGINLGTKGFMACLEQEDIPLVLKAASGEYDVSCRMKLDVTIKRNGIEVYKDSALNDAVIHGYGDCIKLTASCEGDTITCFSGDGIIIATPTGSTGYSMSAGGPIVEPDASNFIISPICAHVMGSRSFVIDPSRHISVLTEKLHGRKAYLSVDGNWALDLQNEDILEIKRSSQCTLMADMGLKSFYEIAYEKLT